MNEVYHFSYDAINIEKHFGKDNYDDAKKYLFCVLKKTGYSDIVPFNESSVIILYDSQQPKLLDYLNANLHEYFYYLLSPIAENKSEKPNTAANPNLNLYKNLKEYLENLNCDNLNKVITDY